MIFTPTSLQQKNGAHGASFFRLNVEEFPRDYHLTRDAGCGERRGGDYSAEIKYEVEVLPDEIEDRCRAFVQGYN